MPTLLPPALARLIGASALPALVALALAAAPQAQVVFDDFEKLDANGVPDFAFGFFGNGAGSGFGPTPGRNNTGTALNIGINPGTGGGFAGVGTGSGSNFGDSGAQLNDPLFTPIDVSGQTYLTFYFRPTSVRQTDTPLLMEIYLQEDLNGDGFNAGTGTNEDQFRADYRVTAPSGAAEWRYVAIPLASFTDFNPTDGRPVGANDGLDLSKIANVVFAFGNLQPNPAAGTNDFAMSFDDIVFRASPNVTFASATTFADFEAVGSDGKPTNGFEFGDSGFGAGTGRSGGTALQIGTNGDGTQGFAGAGTSGNGGAGSLVDVSGAEYITFYFDPGTVATNDVILQVNLQEDLNGNGMFDAAAGGEDEFQVQYRIAPGTGYRFVAIPLAAFTDDNVDVAGPGADDGFDFTKVLNVVFALKNYQAETGDFTVRIDDITFAGGARATSTGLPPALAEAPVAYPNPTAGAATVAFELSEPSDVSVEVFDVLGRRVATLATGAQAAGPVRVDVPAGLTPGLYVVRVQTSAGAATTRFTVVR